MSDGRLCNLQLSETLCQVQCLGAIIRGETPHFECISSETSRGIARAAMEAAVPVIFGVLTTDTGKQALERSAEPERNRGSDAVRAGADSVEHAVDIDDETLREMARRKIFYVPTIDHNRYYVDAARKAGTLKSLRALVLLDMIGDKDLVIRREAGSTPWLVDIIWAAAARLGHGNVFSNELTAVEDDHMHFITAGVPAVDIIDLDYPAWHTADDTLENVSARSLQIVGDVVLAALPDIEARVR